MAQQESMQETFPNLAEMAVTLILTPGYAYGHEFAFGLELILDGIEAARSAELIGPRTPGPGGAAAEHR